MSNKTILDLPDAGSLAGTEEFELVQSGTTSAKSTLANLLAFKTPNPVIATSNYNANNMDLIIADTSGGAFTITLPASPVFGNIISFVDGAGAWNTNNLSISPNGGKIMGTTSTLVINTASERLYLIYYNSSQGWVVG